MEFGFTTILTEKFEETINFYRDVLGFEVYKQFSSNPGVTIAFIRKDGNRIEILQNDNAPPVSNQDTSIQLTFLVEDIEAAYADMKAAGVTILDKPVVLPNGLQMFHGKDPNGLPLGFVKEAP